MTRHFRQRFHTPGPRPRLPAPAVPEPIDHVARIDAIIRNARTSWFALLAVLAFTGVTLLGVTDLDFCGVGRATQLPLINVSVPTDLFFGAAPVLTAAIYAYFHIYLIRLWEALAAAPPEIEGQPLGLKIQPWLVGDAALYIRRLTRAEQPPCLPRRALELPAALLNVAIAWVFGLVVLYFAWVWSFPARNPMLSLFGAGSLVVAAFTGLNSLLILGCRMRALQARIVRAVVPITAVLCAALAYAASYETLRRTNGAIADLAPLDLNGAQVVTRPADWLEREFAAKEFRAHWCKREGLDCSTLTEAQEEAFTEEWIARRAVDIANLQKPRLRWQTGVRLRDAVGSKTGADELQVVESAQYLGTNLQGADLRGAFLSGWDLSAARLARARLDGARLEEAVLYGADLAEAELDGAYLESANLRWANLQGAALRAARLQHAELGFANMQGAELWLARLQYAQLEAANLQDANISGANMQGANLSWANLQDANLTHADLQGALMSRANLQSARLDRASLQGADLWGANLQNARLEDSNLSRAELKYANLKGAWLNEADLQSALLPGANLQVARLDAANLKNAVLVEAILQDSWLRTANLQFARFNRADLQGAWLWRANLISTNLLGANLKEAELNYSLLAGTAAQPNSLGEADLTRSVNRGGAVRFVEFSNADFTGADWRSAFVVYDAMQDAALYTQMGQPCQWTTEDLTDAEFFGRWRWWLTTEPSSANWVLIAPIGWEDVPLNPGPEGCEWPSEIYWDDSLGP